MFLNLLFSKKRKIILSIIILVLIILIILLLTLYHKLDIKINGNKSEFDINSLNLEKYTTNYDMTVISNKNIHTYNVSESYNRNENISILKFLDYTKNEVQIKLNNNTCTISNSGNMLGLTTQITNNNKNISSFSTFIYLYNLIDGSCLCKKKVYSKDNNIILCINICNEDNCKLKKNLGHLDISKLELTLKSEIPKTYIIYDKNGKENISILYNTFKFNVFEE